MRIVLVGCIVGLVGPLLAGCSGATAVSEYAGTPRYLLPKDHVNYQPLHPGVARGPTIDVGKSEKLAGSLDDSFAEEDAHLRKVTKICQNCTTIISAAPARDGESKLAAREAAMATAAAAGR
jgi:hypothetical protein